MILFDLKCSNGHIFEAWFSDSKNFLKQSKNRAISCPFCQNDNIIKAPMAPNISTRRTKEKKGMGVDVAMPLRKGNITQENFSAKASSRKEDSLKKSEKKIMKNFSKEMIQIAADAAESLLYKGLDKTMNQYISQADLTFSNQLTIVITALLASIGAAGIPSAGLVMIFIVTQAVGFQDADVAIIIGTMLAVDRPLDMMRTMVNIFSDSIGASIIANSEGESLYEN